jgi:hypothetical protein
MMFPSRSQFAFDLPLPLSSHSPLATSHCSLSFRASAADESAFSFSGHVEALAAHPHRPAPAANVLMSGAGWLRVLGEASVRQLTLQALSSGESYRKDLRLARPPRTQPAPSSRAKRTFWVRAVEGSAVPASRASSGPAPRLIAASFLGGRSFSSDIKPRREAPSAQGEVSASLRALLNIATHFTDSPLPFTSHQSLATSHFPLPVPRLSMRKSPAHCGAH